MERTGRGMRGPYEDTGSRNHQSLARGFTFFGNCHTPKHLQDYNLSDGIWNGAWNTNRLMIILIIYLVHIKSLVWGWKASFRPRAQQGALAGGHRSLVLPHTDPAGVQTGWARGADSASIPWAQSMDPKESHPLLHPSSPGLSSSLPLSVQGWTQWVCLQQAFLWELDLSLVGVPGVYSHKSPGNSQQQLCAPGIHPWWSKQKHRTHGWAFLVPITQRQRHKGSSGAWACPLNSLELHHTRVFIMCVHRSNV